MDTHLPSSPGKLGIISCRLVCLRSLVAAFRDLEPAPFVPAADTVLRYDLLPSYPLVMGRPLFGFQPAAKQVFFIREGLCMA